MNFTLTQFEPSAERYQQFDMKMRLRLKQSLSYLHDFTKDDLDIPESSLTQSLDKLSAAPILTDTFIAYYELVEAIQDADFVRAQKLFEEVLLPEYAEQDGEIFAFQDPVKHLRSRRFKKMVDTDPSLPFPIHPVREQTFQQACTLIKEAFALMKFCAPDLHDEIREILNVICVGSGPSDPQAYTFDGASAFELWGAIVLNALGANDVVDMVQTLAHESCHVMLFGFCIDGSLVLNPDEERYASPLRRDPRPIDGIFHATFVLARMHYAAKKLYDSGRLNDTLQSKLRSELEERAKSFYDGLHTLKKHARYTPQGEQLIAAAEAYMDSAAGAERSA